MESGGDQNGVGTHPPLSSMLARLTRLTQSVLDRRLAPHGVTFSQTAAMLCLWEAHPRAVSQTELGQVLEMERSSMSTLVTGLLRAGLIEARGDVNDGRRRLLVLSAPGRRLRRPVMGVVDEWEAELVGSLSEADATRLRKSVTHLLGTARKARGRAPAPR
jgi:DNA-binding MarR family transcriptional regulator